MLAELDVFSGRPNPRWRLDAMDAEEVHRLLTRLQALGPDPVQPPGLGYRGFTFWDTYRAYRGQVFMPSAVLADHSSGIERFLLAPTRRTGPPRPPGPPAAGRPARASPAARAAPGPAPGMIPLPDGTFRYSPRDLDPARPPGRRRTEARDASREPYGTRWRSAIGN